MAEQQGQGDFLAGLVVGAVVGGVVGTVIGLSLAPRFSQQQTAKTKSRRLSAGEEPALAGDPMEPTEAEEKLIQVRRSLEEKISQLNEAIQDTRTQLRTNAPASTRNGS